MDPKASQVVVPNSSGTSIPALKVSAKACDCHLHICDDRFPTPASQRRHVPNAAVPDYRLLQRRIGTSRAVVVTPANYRTDNAVTVDAIAQLGNARGVAVVHPNVTDATLRELADAGIRGIRFTIWDPATAVTRVDMIEPLAKRVNELGWHVQIHMMADQLVGIESILQRLPSAIVIDHLGRLPQPVGMAHPAFAIIHRLIDKGRTWVKLSGAYLNTKVGPPFYSDTVAIARAYVQAAPERMVWGSDWPHPTELHKPDDAVLMNLLADWAPDEPTRRRILVDNPAQLYGF